MSDKAFSDAEETDLVGLEISHPALDRSILIPFSCRSDLNLEKILVTIQKVTQSRRELTFDENLGVKVTRVKPPNGTGYRRQNTARFDEWFPTKQCIIQIQNNDDLCCARALIVARARLDKDPRWETIRKGDQNRYTLQRKLAQQLMTEAGLTDHTGPCGIPELQKLQVLFLIILLCMFYTTCISMYLLRL